MLDWQTILYNTTWGDLPKERKLRVVRRMKHRFTTPYIRGTKEGNLIPLPLIRDSHLKNIIPYDLLKLKSLPYPAKKQVRAVYIESVGAILNEAHRRDIHSLTTIGDLGHLWAEYANTRCLPWAHHRVDMLCTTCTQSHSFWIPFEETLYIRFPIRDTRIRFACAHCWAANIYNEVMDDQGCYRTWNMQMIDEDIMFNERIDVWF